MLLSFPQALTSSAMHFSFCRHVCPSTAGTFSLISLFFLLISHKTPPHSSSVDFRQSHLYDVYSVCFFILHCPLYFLHLVYPLLLPTFPPTPKCFLCLNMKSTVFIFPIASQRTYESIRQPIICLSLSFSPETPLAE